MDLPSPRITAALGGSLSRVMAPSGGARRSELVPPLVTLICFISSWLAQCASMRYTSVGIDEVTPALLVKVSENSAPTTDSLLASGFVSSARTPRMRLRLTAPKSCSPYQMKRLVDIGRAFWCDIAN